MRTLILALAGLTVLASSTAQAQSCRHGAAPVIRHRGWVHTHRPHHASTVAASYAHGRADVIRAWGQNNLLTSQARINHAEARRRETENSVHHTQAYFHRKEINRSYRYGRRVPGPPRTTVAVHTEPVDGGSTLDSLLIDGHVAWPRALRDPVYANQRALVERILLTQKGIGASTESDRAALAQASREMTCLLREHVQSCTPQEFVDAKLFFKALCHISES